MRKLINEASPYGRYEALAFARMKRRLCRREAKSTVTFPCAEGTLHGARLCFIFHAPQVRFIEKSRLLSQTAFFWHTLTK